MLTSARHVLINCLDGNQRFAALGDVLGVPVVRLSSLAEWKTASAESGIP